MTKLKYIGKTPARIRVPSASDPKIDVLQGQVIEVVEAMADFLLTNHDYTGAFVLVAEDEKQDEKPHRVTKRSTQELKHIKKS